MSKGLAIPRLSSDTVGRAIRDSLEGQGKPGEAFHAGYEVLFTLVDEFITCGCSVIVDTSMGWEFQWERLDAIVRGHAAVTFVPIILRCPLAVCVERIRERHRQDPQSNASPEGLMGQSHIQELWHYLDNLDRPDLRVIDASRSPMQILAAGMEFVT
jgi:predicted kinase